MRGTLRVALIILLCLSTLLPVSSLAVGGDDVLETWSDISADGLVATLYCIDGEVNSLHLVISGSGEMRDFAPPDAAPWHNGYSQRITKVTLEAGISYVGQNSFYSLENLGELYVENPNMIFPVSTYNVIPDQTVIFSHIKSTANKYAEWFSVNFKPTCRFSDAPCEICGYICNEPPPLCTPGYCPSCKTTHADTVVHVSNGVTAEAIPPGCESAGRVAHTNCIHCGIPLDASGNPQKYVDIPPLSHTFSWSDGVLPTCETQGSIGYFSCTVCSKIFDANKNEIFKTDIAPTGHTGGCATCADKPCCVTCGKEYGQPDPNAHSYAAGFIYGDEGHARSCVCGAHTEFSSHTYTETVIKAPTALFVGQKEKVCACGYKLTEEMPRLEMPENESDSLDEGEHPSILFVIFLSAIGVALAAATTFLLVRMALTHKSDEKGENDV